MKKKGEKDAVTKKDGQLSSEELLKIQGGSGLRDAPKTQTTPISDDTKKKV